MDFSGFLGNQEVKSALSAAFKAGRFPHTLLLQGEPGTGKRTMAKRIAQALVCRHPEKAPCGSCPSCIRARAGSHPDIRLVEPVGSARSITVDAVLKVIEDAHRVPEEADRRVYILVLGSRPSEAAQNKLLKILEEPPADAVFLLVCVSAEQLLPTVRSRAQCFTLRPPTVEETAAYLTDREGLAAEEALRLARLTDGNIGRCLELQKTRGGVEGELQAFDLAQTLAHEALSIHGDGLLKAVLPLYKDRVLCREVLVRLEILFRDACVLRAGADKLLSGMPQTAEELCALPRAVLLQRKEQMRELIRRLDGNANLNLLVTCLCAALREKGGRSVSPDEQD